MPTPKKKNNFVRKDIKWKNSQKEIEKLWRKTKSQKIK